MSSYLRPFQMTLLERVKLAMHEVLAGGDSQGILLIADSGAGKTHALDVLAAHYAGSLTADHQVTPCVRCALNPGATALSVSKAVMVQLKRPIVTRKDAQEHVSLAFDALRARQTRLFIAEEVHNGMLAGRTEFRKQNKDYFKSLWNLEPQDSPLGWTASNRTQAKHAMVTVLSGTEELWRAVQDDSELRSRYSTHIFAPSLGLYPPESLREFRLVFRAMVARCGLGHLVSANDDTLVPQALLASGAHLRILKTVLTRLSTLMELRRGATTDIRSLFHEAFIQSTDLSAMPKDPFEMTAEDIAKAFTNARKEYERQKPASRRRDKTTA